MVPDKSLGKFWPDLEISEAYLMGLVYSLIFGWFCVLESQGKKQGLIAAKSQIYHSITLHLRVCELYYLLEVLAKFLRWKAKHRNWE